MKLKKSKFPIHLTTNKLSSNSQKAVTLANTKKLGEIKNKQVIYSLFEALYLVENKKAEILKNNRLLTSEQLTRILSKKGKEFATKYSVFRYLRKKGYILKTGLKFGGEFRVYEKKSKHAKYICYPVTESSKINWQDFIARNRIAHSTSKKLLIAVVDSEEDVLFYETNWIKP